ncbi:unnamed protein product [Gongylonema pulchrum]|uniref:WH1 domain-containing protein n=1 Tax=Gongylonema pulchrum TaxID=637853 RepID=A0A183DPF7_9BILA|nr:unnamed protein product [Gongylonema pulchrum]
MAKFACTDSKSSVWSLIKYTRLLGPHVEIPAASGQKMLISYNKSRRYLSVLYKGSVLEEFSLAAYVRLTVKSKDLDVFFQVASTGGAQMTRFRVKFASQEIHASFIEFISLFVKVLPPSSALNCSTDFSQSQSVSTCFKLPSYSHIDA